MADRPLADLPFSPSLPARLPLQMNYQNKHLIGAMIVAGWDAEGGGQARAAAAASTALIRGFAPVPCLASPDNASLACLCPCAG